jgi:hypothetical protein
VLLEYACSDDSALGKAAEACGWVVYRFTETVNNLQTAAGVKALNAIIALHKDDFIVIWSSIPCTPWTQWQRLNAFKLGPRFRALLAEKRAASVLMLETFIAAARKVRSFKGRVCFEWPRECDGWALQQIRDMLLSFAMQQVKVDGCSVGMRDEASDRPVLKKWLIATDAPLLANVLTPCRCSRDHEHATIQGGVTARTAFYSPEFAAKIMLGLDAELVRKNFALCNKNGKCNSKGYLNPLTDRVCNHWALTGLTCVRESHSEVLRSVLDQKNAFDPWYVCILCNAAGQKKIRK